MGMSKLAVLVTLKMSKLYFNEYAFGDAESVSQTK